jgi:hypothetical protein
MSRRPLHVVPTQPITPDEARACLMALDPGAINASQLAREWGWSRAKVRRFILKLRGQGVIAPAPPRSSASQSTPAAPAAETTPPPQQGESPMPMKQIPYLNAIPPFPGDVADEASSHPDADAAQSDGFEEQLPLPPAPPFLSRLPSADRLLAAALGTAAVVLGTIGLVLNVTYAQAFGQSALAATLLATVGAVIDVLAIMLPTVAANLRAKQKRGAAAAAWVCWAGALLMTLLAASGFAATNIGDAIQGRSKVTDERATLTTKLDELRTDRNAIGETRAPKAIEALIQQEEARIRSSVWSATARCTAVNGAGRVCNKINGLRAAKADAERRDKLAGEIKIAEESLRDLPAYSGPDPGADMAAKLMSAAMLGIIHVTPEAIQQIRVAGLTLAPAASGLLLLFASLLWRARREEEEPLPSLV